MKHWNKHEKIGWKMYNYLKHIWEWDPEELVWNHQAHYVNTNQMINNQKDGNVESWDVFHALIRTGTLLNYIRN